MILSWWPFVLLALAAWRTWLLIAEDTILDRPRRRIRSEAVGEWLTCPRCAGFWVGLAWWIGWLAWPHGTLLAATPMALAAVVALIARWADRD